MRHLSRIILINWYLFEAEEWDVRGHVALLGKNGSGKSSFIDALQYVLLGGHKQDWTPNAKASDQRQSRDLRSYVLGVVKDESALGNTPLYRPRQDGLCRIVLVFTDKATNENVTIGAAISARREEPGEHVEGFFILKGATLSLSDLVEETAQGKVPKSYEVLTASFRHRVPESNRYLFGHEPQKFVDQLLRTLGPDKRPPAIEKYRRGFRQSINLSGLNGSVSDFVKRSVLDAQPLNLEQTRQSINTYRNKLEAVERSRIQVRLLDECRKHFNRAHSAGQRRAGYVWCAAELRFLSHDVKLEELVELLVGCASEYRQARIDRRELSEQLSQQETRQREVLFTINSDQNEVNRAQLMERSKTKRVELDQTKKQINDARGLLGRASEVVLYKDVLSDDIITLMDTLVRLAKAEDMAWPMEPEEVDSEAANARSILPEIIEQAEINKEKLAVDINHITTNLSSLADRHKRLDSGQSNLGKNTLALIAELDDHGITATPVCELVEITEPRWSLAIEAYLRQNAEALVVPSSDAKRAVVLYREMKNTPAYEAIIINTIMVGDWNDRVEPDMAAELITGKDDIAVKYLRRLLMGLRLVETTDELMGETHALTPDGMFIRHAGIRRLRLPDIPILGLGSHEKAIQILNEKIEATREQLNESTARHKQLGAAWKALNELNNNLQRFPDTLQLVSNELEAKREIENIRRQIDAIDTSHLDELKREEQVLDKDIKKLKPQIRSHTENIGACRSEFRSKNHDRHEIKKLLPALDDDRKAKATDTDFIAERTYSLYTELENEFTLHSSRDYDKAIGSAEERAKEADKRKGNAEGEGRERLGNYLSAYPSDGFIMETMSCSLYLAEIDQLLKDIRDVGLIDREKQAEDALSRVRKVIRSDLAIRLHGHIEQMKRRFNELNNELKIRPFSSNQTYAFTYSRITEFSEFLGYVENITRETAADTGGMFDQHTDLDTAVIERMLTEEKSELADYREFFTYDITIKDTESGITEMLSKKIGSASGGEHRTPFYVAMGASLASAYRLERREDALIDGGFALYLADEAFDKMDAVNTIQAAEYLKSIGLQLFIAAPDDAEAKMRYAADTVLYFLRDGPIVNIDTDFVTPAARQLLAGIHGTENSTSV